MSEAELESGDYEGGEYEGEGSEGSEPSAEERAALTGWREDGDLSAEEFLEKRDSHLGLAKSNNERLEREILETRKAMDEMAKMQKAFMAKERKAGYEQAMADIKEQKSQAIANADPEAFQDAENKERELQESQVQEEQQSQQQANRERLVEVARNTNETYPEVFETRARANDWAEELKYQMGRGLSLDEAATKAVSAVAEKHGLKQKQPGALESGNRSQGGNKSFNDLPKSAKEAYKKFESQGLFEGEEGKKEYAEEYWSQA